MFGSAGLIRKSSSINFLYASENGCSVLSFISPFSLYIYILLINYYFHKRVSLSDKI